MRRGTVSCDLGSLAYLVVPSYFNICVYLTPFLLRGWTIIDCTSKPLNRAPTQTILKATSEQCLPLKTVGAGMLLG